jgi:signal transduction histidine kinase
VADAGGVVDVRSAPGAGTRVEIAVPLLRPDSASVETG